MGASLHHSTKRKSMVWEEPKKPLPKKFKTVLLAKKVMYKVFGDEKGSYGRNTCLGYLFLEERAHPSQHVYPYTIKPY